MAMDGSRRRHHHGILLPSWETNRQEDEEELRHALLCVALELESTRAAAQEELRSAEAQALHLARLLDAATRERDEARHSLLFLKENHAHHPPTIEEGKAAAAGSSSEEADSGSGNVVSSIKKKAALEAEVEAAVARRGLPEKGRLVEAVIAAGPLLQTLMLAGPLPEWRHPPPPLSCFDIPLVSISMAPRSPSPSPTTILNPTSSSSPDSYRSGKRQKVAMPSNL